MVGEKELIVRKIERGTVIDHIPAGYALHVLKLLGITGKEGIRIAIVMNVESKKLGKKDIVKVENIELSEDTVNRIALIAPTATINIIRDYKVVLKRKVKIPKRIEGLLTCINPRCITNQPREPVTPRFRVIERNPLRIVCEYCETIMEHEEIIRQLIGE